MSEEDWMYSGEMDEEESQSVENQLYQMTGKFSGRAFHFSTVAVSWMLWLSNRIEFLHFPLGLGVTRCFRIVRGLCRLISGIL